MPPVIKYFGVPRSVIDAEIGEMEGWKHLGHRMLEAVKKECPVGVEGEGYQGPHLKDTLEVKFITGADPRILIGSKTKGDVLAYIEHGTSAHTNVGNPLLRWIDKETGEAVFRPQSTTPARDARPFVLKAAGSVFGSG